MTAEREPEPALTYRPSPEGGRGARNTQVKRGLGLSSAAVYCSLCDQWSEQRGLWCDLYVGERPAESRKCPYMNGQLSRTREKRSS